MKKYLVLLNNGFRRQLPKPYAIPIILGVFYCGLSFLTRVALVIASNELASFLGFIGIFCYGFLYDLTTSLWFSVPALLYFTWVSERWYNAHWHRRLTGALTLMLCWAMSINAFAEYFFWQEYSARLNFVALDYLIYPKEVISFFWESYPVVPVMLLLAGLIAFSIWGIRRLGWWDSFFHGELSRREAPSHRHLAILGSLVLATILVGKINMPGTFSVVQQELAKNGLFSLSATVYNTIRPYQKTYPCLDNIVEIRRGIQELVSSPDAVFPAKDPLHPQLNPLARQIEGRGGDQIKPNVVLIIMESFSGEYLRQFGDTQGLTPFASDLAERGLLFTNFYAAGIRTVGGLEAMLTSRPTLPNKSLLKRDDNIGIQTLANVFNKEGYASTYIYGGDSHFDNQKRFLSGNGFKVLDLYHWMPEQKSLFSLLSDSDRETLESNGTSKNEAAQSTGSLMNHKGKKVFQTAWGVCDEEIYQWILDDCDAHYQKHQPFFTSTITLSNHIPFFYPDGKIDLPAGSQTASAKYADFALGEFFKEAEKKPWAKNTIFVIVADHCAHRSESEIDLSPNNFHIPLIFYSPNPSLVKPGKNDILGSQVDLGPTLFGMMGWSYDSTFFGHDLTHLPPAQGRALIATFKHLGLYRDDVVTLLAPVSECPAGFQALHYDRQTRLSKPIKNLQECEKQIRATQVFYQSAMYTYALLVEKNRQMRIDRSKLLKKIESLLRDPPNDGEPDKY
jgi:phosphoglycerol transferase MdoB-like AlkP superfamily enzyme